MVWRHNCTWIAVALLVEGGTVGCGSSTANNGPAAPARAMAAPDDQPTSPGQSEFEHSGGDSIEVSLDPRR
jgi:hypothetical protein